jgi:hypothetical protein
VRRNAMASLFRIGDLVHTPPRYIDCLQKMTANR